MTYLLGCPGAFVDARVEAVVPPLPALVAVAGADGLGDLAPARAVELDGFTQPLVFLPHPRALAYRVGNAVVPALPAVLVVASWQVAGDLVPAYGAVFLGFCGVLVVGGDRLVHRRRLAPCYGFREESVLIRGPHLPRLLPRHRGIGRRRYEGPR